MAFGPLFTYATDTLRLLGRDETQDEWNPDDIIRWINIARGEVAKQGQCIRLLSPISGSILTLQVTNPGAGYTAPTLAISAPDSPNGYLPYPAGAQATGTVAHIGGQISNASVNFGGSGYFQPTATVHDPTGVGAVVVPTVTPINATSFNQEVYRFADVPISASPGVQAILSVRSVAILWSNWQWTIARTSFSRYQAVIRQYVNSYNAPPVWAAQFGQGVNGTLHLFPRPDQVYQMQWDCLCLPNDLVTDQDYEAIPDPWRAAVPYYAAHLGLLSKASIQPQFMSLASAYFNGKPGDGGFFGLHMRRSRAYAEPGVASSFYGRV
jgi:hypothetical protein